MLPESITLALPNGGTPVNEIATRIDVFTNRSSYNLAGHSPALRKQLGFYRTLPKRQGKFLGVTRSAVKVTLDIDVPNSVGEPTVQPLIADLGFAVPIGATEAEFDGLLDRVEALVKAQRAILKRTIFGPEI